MQLLYIKLIRCFIASFNDHINLHFYLTDNYNINRIDAINIRCHQSLQFKWTIVIALFNEFYCSGRYIMVEWKCHKKQCFCIKQWLRCYIYSYLLKYILISFYFNEWDTTHKKLVVWGIQFIKIRFNHIFFMSNISLEGSLARHPLLSRVVARYGVFKQRSCRSLRLYDQVQKLKYDV